MLSIGDFARLAGVTPRALRHYGDVGLLPAASVDPVTGYRSYSLDQLADLRRILVLRDLGLGLDQIGEVLAEGPSVERLRGMLQLRRAELAASLQRIEAHLDAIERGAAVMEIDVVLKHTDPLRAAVTTTSPPGWGFENMNPVFESILPQVWAELVSAGVRTGIPVAFYDVLADDQPRAHLGFDIGDQVVAANALVRVEEAPVIEVASTLLRGPMDTVADTFEALVRWVEANGREFAGASRELYLESEPDGSPKLTELQVAVFPPGWVPCS